jgi:hypothetical protein
MPPQYDCEYQCPHDLVRGVLISELHGPHDGGYEPFRMPPPVPVIREGRIQME